MRAGAARTRARGAVTLAALAAGLLALGAWLRSERDREVGERSPLPATALTSPARSVRIAPIEPSPEEAPSQRVALATRPSRAAPSASASDAFGPEPPHEWLVALTVLHPSGAPVPAPAFFAPRPETGERLSIDAVADGERWLLSLALPERVSVEAHGFRTLDVEVDGDRTLVLEPGIRVVLRLAGPLPALPEGWSLSGELVRRVFGVAGAEDRRRTREGRFPLDRGLAELRVAEPGSYLFLFAVHPSNAPSGGGSSFWNEPQPVLEVRDDGMEQVFALDGPDADTRAEIDAYLRTRASGLGDAGTMRPWR